MANYLVYAQLHTHTTIPNKSVLDMQEAVYIGI